MVLDMDKRHEKTLARMEMKISALGQKRMGEPIEEKKNSNKKQRK